jgi:MraZ protein
VFLGEDRHTVDGKGRLVLPSRYRDQLVDGCVITKGRDGQLMVYPVDEYMAQAETVRRLPDNRDGRRFARTFFAGADEQSLDKAGRLLLKQELRTYSQVEVGSETVVLGVFDHIELWNPEAYADERLKGDEVYMADEDGEDDPT